jgi:hypothetical protein
MSGPMIADIDEIFSFKMSSKMIWINIGGIITIIISNEGC